MSAILDLITGGIGPYLIAALGALFGVIMALLRGKAKREARDAKSYRNTTEEMQNVEADMGDDPAVLRDWLRDRNPDQR